MLPRSYDQIDCSIARTMEVVGDRWTLLVVRNALVGMTRFEDFQRSLGITPNVLTGRLARLAEEGIVERRQYCTRPARYEYAVTDKGRQLWPLLAAMVTWGDRYYAPHGAPRQLLHLACGGPVVEQLTCRDCHTVVHPRTSAQHPAPGHAPLEFAPPRPPRRCRPRPERLAAAVPQADRSAIHDHSRGRATGRSEGRGPNRPVRFVVPRGCGEFQPSTQQQWLCVMS